jgi:hypothetical protein
VADDARRATVFAPSLAACHTAQHKPLPRTLSDENGLSFWDPDLNDPRLRFNRHALFNLTRPGKSLFLRAPLAVSAGGLGVCTATNGTCTPVFASLNDPDYRVLRHGRPPAPKLECQAFDSQGSARRANICARSAYASCPTL